MPAMDRRQTDFLLKFAAGALTVAGVVVVLVGYLGVRDHDDLVLQLPYVVSGGLGGLGLIGLGALALIQYQSRVHAAVVASLSGALEEWQERAQREAATRLVRRRGADSDVVGPAARAGGRRTVYDVAHGGERDLPGKKVRGEGDRPVSDTAVNEAYDGAGLTYRFYKDVYDRD